MVACHNLNGLESNETWRKVGWLTSQVDHLPMLFHVTTACHHCVEPGCLSGCPVVAYEKDPTTGIVRHLDDQCFGCKYCTMMCPYEVPQYSATLGIVRKCDMCSQRLQYGEAPACVQACPNSAIRITVVETAGLRDAYCQPTSTLLPTAPPSDITIPTTRYRTQHTQAMPSLLSLESVVDYPHPGHLPLVGMLVLTQASVGMWTVIAFQLVADMHSVHRWAIASVTASILGALGVQLALLHLGRPWLAYRAILDGERVG